MKTWNIRSNPIPKFRPHPDPTRSYPIPPVSGRMKKCARIIFKVLPEHSCAPTLTLRTYNIMRSVDDDRVRPPLLEAWRSGSPAALCSAANGFLTRTYSFWHPLGHHRPMEPRSTQPPAHSPHPLLTVLPHICAQVCAVACSFL